LKRFLLIFSDRIFDSSVDRGCQLRRSPLGPNIRPTFFQAASIMSFSHESLWGVQLAVSGLLSAEAAEVTSFSSIEKISASQISSTAR